jgi:hypothetical protein
MQTIIDWRLRQTTPAFLHDDTATGYLRHQPIFWLFQLTSDLLPGPLLLALTVNIGKYLPRD